MRPKFRRLSQIESNNQFEISDHKPIELFLIIAYWYWKGLRYKAHMIDRTCDVLKLECLRLNSIGGTDMITY